MTDEVEKITDAVVLAALREHYGDWVIRGCFHKGDEGIIVQFHTGQVFIITAHEVSGLIVT